MKEQTSVFGRQVRHQLLSEKKILDSFGQSSLDEIVDALKAVLDDSHAKYVKIVEMIEAAALGNDEIFSKWQSAQARVNEEAFGIVDWAVLLDELAQADAGQNDVLDETAGERARIREKIPTSIVNPAPMDIEPLPFVLTALEEAGEVRDGAEESRSEEPSHTLETSPPTPESKEALVSQIEEMAAAKRMELETIHTEKVRVIKEHEEKLISDCNERIGVRTAQLKKLKDSLADVIGTGIENEFEMKLKSDQEGKIGAEINKLTRDLGRKIERIKKKSEQELSKAGLRQKKILEQFENQIQKSQDTYQTIEHSGLFLMEDIMNREQSRSQDNKTVLSFLSSAKQEIDASGLQVETLKEYRDRSTMLLSQYQDQEVQEEAIAVLSALVFSSLEGQSKGKIISELIGALVGSAASPAARSLSELARDDRFVFRISEKDAATVLGLVNDDVQAIKRAVILLISNQLYLERNRVIPKLSKKLSRDMQNELINTFSENRSSPIIKEICELGYIKAPA